MLDINLKKMQYILDRIDEYRNYSIEEYDDKYRVPSESDIEIYEPIMETNLSACSGIFY